MKEPVSKFNMEAAFKALDEIDIPKVSGGIIPNRVNLKESMRVIPQTDILFEEYYDLNSGEDVDAAKEEREAEVAKAKLARIEKIVDLDAETEDDILPSYAGKMIMQCPQCMTLFYKNPEDIEYSEENPDVVNINEVCQHCGNASGYTLVGKVAKVGEDEADKYDTDEVEDILDAKEEAEADQEQPAEEQPAEESTEEEAPAEENTEELPELPELPAEEEEEKEETNESLNNSEAQKDAEKHSELATENKSENLTLNEDLPAEEQPVEEANAEEEIVEESLNNSEAQKEAEENSELATDNKSENLSLNEGIMVEVELADAYEPWQGAVDTWEKIKEADKISELEDYLNTLYPDGGLTLTQINDMLWFNGDQVLADLGLAEEPVEESLNEAEGDNLTTGEIDHLLNSKEFKTPISERETEHYLNELDKMTEACKNSECENKPLEECDKQPLKEAEEDEAAEEVAIEDAPEAQEEAEVAEVEETSTEEETAEDGANTEAEETVTEADVQFNAEEVKDIAETVATEVAHMATEIETGRTEADGETLDRANDYADNAVEKAVEEKTEEAAPAEEEEEVAEETVEEQPEEKTEEAEEEAEEEQSEEAEDNDEEIVALLGEIDDASVEECLNKSLQEVYSNVENFKLNSKTINEEKDLVVEGLINFKSGKQKATRYIFNECVCDETPDAIIIELKGINNDLADDGVFVLNCKGCKDAPMMAESFSYNYHIGETLVEGLIK